MKRLPEPQTLAETQALFFALITAPTSVAEALADRGGDPALARTLVGDRRLSATERLDLYANMYFWRLHDILRGDYPVLLALLGEDGFRNLTTSYLLACPSRHFSVRNVGDRLGEFLAHHDARRPWLAELATLERARLEVFDGPDAAPLSLDELRQVAPERLAEVVLRLVPSHLRLQADHAVDDLWRAHARELRERDVNSSSAHEHQAQRGEAPPAAPPAPAPRTLLVWRQELLVHHRALLPLEAEALAGAAAGIPFGLVCERLAAALPDEEATRLAFSLLVNWANDGLLARPG